MPDSPSADTAPAHGPLVPGLSRRPPSSSTSPSRLASGPHARARRRRTTVARETLVGPRRGSIRRPSRAAGSPAASALAHRGHDLVGVRPPRRGRLAGPPRRRVREFGQRGRFSSHAHGRESLWREPLHHPRPPLSSCRLAQPVMAGGWPGPARNSTAAGTTRRARPNARGRGTSSGNRTAALVAEAAPSASREATTSDCGLAWAADARLARAASRSRRRTPGRKKRLHGALDGDPGGGCRARGTRERRGDWPRARGPLRELPVREEDEAPARRPALRRMVRGAGPALRVGRRQDHRVGLVHLAPRPSRSPALELLQPRRREVLLEQGSGPCSRGAWLGDPGAPRPCIIARAGTSVGCTP